MENKNISHDFREVTAVENPRFVQYINNKRVVIAGVHGAYIVNPIKDKVIRHLNSFDYYNRIKESNITVSKNKQRIISFYDTKIVGYSAENGTQEWCLPTNYIRSFACDAEGETVFICYQGSGVEKYQYSTEKKQNAITGLYNKCFYSIAMHPSKKDVCISQYPNKLFLSTFNGSSLTFKKEILVLGGYILEYSPDGSHLAAYGDLFVHIIDVNIDDNKYSYTHMKHTKEKIRGLAFHPNNIILTTLEKNYIEGSVSMCYWDIKKKQLIGEVDLNVKEAYHFAFSDDGLHMIIAVEGKCLTGLVPFKIRWHNQYPYFLFLLKNYLNQCPEMPRDITYYVMNILYRA